MIRDDDQALEEILGPTRAFLEPEAADEARIFQGLRQALGTSVAAPRISPALEKRQPEPHVPSAPRSHAGLVKLASVGVIAASLGFFMGFGMGRQSASSDSGGRAVSLDANGSERPVENLGVPTPVRPDGPTKTPLASLAGTSNTGELAVRDDSEASPSQLPSSRTAPTGVASRMPRRTSQATLPAGLPGAAKDEGDGLSLGQALELLQRARSAQAAGRPNTALLVLSELDRRASGDMLTEERLLATVLVWCDLGNQHEANRLAQALRDKNQSSIYSRRLAHSCAGAVHDATSGTVGSEKR